jgi:hypothetical protein
MKVACRGRGLHDVRRMSDIFQRPPGKGTLEKALGINLDPTIYGTIAEIGAGQEIANWFFRAGGAAGTIAKTMSAYDMTFSDEIYGRCDRYVSCQRLKAMLVHEYSILQQRLDEKRGADTTFFALADTVRARSFKDQDSNACMGWMGIQFQDAPRGGVNQLVLHVRLLDDTNAEQAAALGILGVNILSAAFYARTALPDLMRGLMEGLDRRRIEIDMLHVEGPCFADRAFDDRICALGLVEQGLADAALFAPDGTIQQAADVFYGRPVMLKRGSFDPVTRLHMDMLAKGVEAFQSDIVGEAGPCIEVMELTMNNLLTREGTVDKEDFLARADVLQALGKYVLVSKYARFFRLSEFVTRHTRKPVGIVLGVPLFAELFQEKWYEEIPGGLLESFGRMLRHGLRMYVYPMGERDSGKIITARTARVPVEQQGLRDYLIGIGQVREIASGDPQFMFTSSYEVREMWLRGDPRWESLVPGEVLQHDRWKNQKIS